MFHPVPPRALHPFRQPLFCNHMVAVHSGVPTRSPSGSGQLQLGDAEVDRLFRALADATRRDILVQTCNGDLSVSALARRYPMSLTAVQKHVAVLESAGLVRRDRRGRETIVKTRPDTLATARAVLDALEVQWRDRLERFGEALAPEQQDADQPAADQQGAQP